MGHIAGVDSRQMTMSIGCIEDEIPQDSPVRFIEVFVDSLDLESMGFEHAVPAPTGRPPYSPYLLVKLYIYGYLNRIRSSRRLMRECRRNIELWFLLNRLCPDFRTIADFRRKHRKLLKKIFLRLSKNLRGRAYFNRARRRVRRARFFRSASEGKTIHPVRKSPGKS